MIVTTPFASTAKEIALPTAISLLVPSYARIALRFTSKSMPTMSATLNKYLQKVGILFRCALLKLAAINASLTSFRSTSSSVTTLLINTRQEQPYITEGCWVRGLAASALTKSAQQKIGLKPLVKRTNNIKFPTRPLRLSMRRSQDWWICGKAWPLNPPKKNNQRIKQPNSVSEFNLNP